MSGAIRCGKARMNATVCDAVYRKCAPGLGTPPVAPSMTELCSGGMTLPLQFQAAMRAFSLSNKLRPPHFLQATFMN